jgi:hypothetical protein
MDQQVLLNYSKRSSLLTHCPAVILNHCHSVLSFQWEWVFWRLTQTRRWHGDSELLPAVSEWRCVLCSPSLAQAALQTGPVLRHAGLRGAHEVDLRAGPQDVGCVRLPDPPTHPPTQPPTSKYAHPFPQRVASVLQRAHVVAKL